MENGQIEPPQEQGHLPHSAQNSAGNNEPPPSGQGQTQTPQQPQAFRRENINPVIVQPMGGAAMRDMRERLFEALFIRFSVLYAARFPMSARRLFESFLLFLALSSLGLLTYAHTGLTYIHADCLSQMKEAWPKDGILRVEVVRNADPSYNLEKSYAKEDKIRRKQEQLDGLDMFFPYSEHALLEEPNEDAQTKDAILQYNPEDGIVDAPDMENASFNETIESISIPEDISLDEPPTSQGSQDSSPTSQASDSNLMDIYSEAYIIEYASDYGILHLTQNTRRRLNVPMGLFVVDPDKGQCLKKSLDIFIFDNFLGYDDFIMEAIKQIADGEVNKGNLRNIITGESFHLIKAGVGGVNYITVALVMIIFTLSVSMLLRYSHNQIFVFIVEVLNVIEANVQMSFPVGQMLTVILALVGMESIMSEFFKDSTTSFYVIVLVWFCDQYDGLCSHTITKKYWPRFFFLYHFAFYAHHYRFHGQHSELALFTSSLFVVHIMVYFYHHHELPQILGGAENARQERHQRATDIQTLGVIIQNYINRPAQPQRPEANAEGLQGIPGVVIRNPRDENRFGNILRQNVVLGMGGVHQHAHMRSAHLSVIFRNLRNAVRNGSAAAPTGAAEVPSPPDATEAPPQNTEEDAPTVVSETTTEQQEIIARIDGDSDSAFTPLSGASGRTSPSPESLQSPSSTSEPEIRQRHINQHQ